jgi:hypothetical protein
MFPQRGRRTSNSLIRHGLFVQGESSDLRPGTDGPKRVVRANTREAAGRARVTQEDLEVKRAVATATICLGLAVAGTPAQAADGNGGRSATAKECTALQRADRAAFKTVYGDHAMRTCMKGVAPLASKTSPREFKGAVRDCRAAREHDRVLFQDTYGTNSNKRNAFGKCVAAQVKA